MKPTPEVPFLSFHLLSRFSLFTLAAATLTMSASLCAGPEGGNIVGGAGSISRANNTTTILQESDLMAIDWLTYDVNVDERVHYIQPTNNSVSLNRIMSNFGSTIHGRIDANGHVILVNPNGVVFGENSVINAGGFIASGLSIDPDNFMNGDFTFSALEGTDGVVINSGLINASTGGSIALIGQQVENQGLISAQLGTVSLVAGREAIVTFDGSGMLGVQVSKEILQDEIGVDPAVINSGEITAEDGQILISGSVSEDIFSQAVNADALEAGSSVVVHEDGSFTLGGGADVLNTGVISVSGSSGGEIVVLGQNVNSSGDIQANSETDSTAGAIEIHSVDTTLISSDGRVTADAANGVGGDIKILGDLVGVEGQAFVSASGENGGGQVLFGGDITGANPQVRNASIAFVGEGTEIHTDAWGVGDGGNLITFAIDTTGIYGDLFSRGGQLGGNGGFIETSGLYGFEIFSAPNVSAVNGFGGEWLIDPVDINIVAGSGSILLLFLLQLVPVLGSPLSFFSIGIA